MITIDYRHEEGSRSFSLSVYGHARYAEYGQDIVCAGVSAIALGLAKTLINDGVKCDLLCNKGRFKASVDDASESTAAIFRYAYLTLESIAEEYPSHVSLGTLPD